MLVKNWLKSTLLLTITWFPFIQSIKEEFSPSDFKCLDRWRIKILKVFICISIYFKHKRGKENGRGCTKFQVYLSSVCETCPFFFLWEIKEGKTLCVNFCPSWLSKGERVCAVQTKFIFTLWLRHCLFIFPRFKGNKRLLRSKERCIVRISSSQTPATRDKKG